MSAPSPAPAEPKPRPPFVLGVETSCDDTACAVLDGDGRVLASVVSSQMVAHRPYGGVVPEIASREHLANWPTVYRRALEEAGVGIGSVDAIAATSGPGLVGSLLVGLSLGKALAYARRLPFFAVHHLEGHLYSPFLVPDAIADPVPERFVGLVVSGGHTALYAVGGGAAPRETVVTLGETLDDAMGEAFDKVGKRLGLPFPGGPRVDRLAETASPDAGAELDFAVPRCASPLDFSFSGLKTRALHWIERLERDGVPTDLEAEQHPRALALLARFRAAAVAQVLDRVERCFEQAEFSCLAVSGGVAANRLLRRELERWAAGRRVELRLVPIRYSGDNAAMIAFAALRRLARGEPGDDPRAVEAVSRLPLGPRAAAAPAAGEARGATAGSPAAKLSRDARR